MGQELVDYALTRINTGKTPSSGRADSRLTVAADIDVRTCRDHADPVTHALITEVRVTLTATGAVFYLPLPTDPYLPTTPPATPGAPDELDSLALPALRSLAGEYGVAKSGSKPQLVERIREHRSTT